MNRAQSKSRPVTSLLPFIFSSPPPPPPRRPRDTALASILLPFVSTTAVHRLHLIASPSSCNDCESYLIAVDTLRECNAERLRQGLIPASCQFPLGQSRVPKPQDPGVILTLTRLPATPWYLILGSQLYPTDSQLDVALGHSLEAGAVSRSRFADLCRSQWQVGD